MLIKAQNLDAYQKSSSGSIQHTFFFILYFPNFSMTRTEWVLFVDEARIEKTNGCVYFWVFEESACRTYLHLFFVFFFGLWFRCQFIPGWLRGFGRAICDADHFHNDRIWFKGIWRLAEHCVNILRPIWCKLFGLSNTANASLTHCNINTNQVWGNRIMLISGPYLLMLLQRLLEWLARRRRHKKIKEMNHNTLARQTNSQLNATLAMPLHSLSLSLSFRALVRCLCALRIHIIWIMLTQRRICCFELSLQISIDFI